MVKVFGNRDYSVSKDAVRIAPSVIAADFTRLGEQLREAEAAGADLHHVDIMDGHFVPNITFGADIVRAIRRSTTLELDVHLMISEPDRYLSAFAEAGANVISVHYEACTHLHRTLTTIHSLGCRAGVAINPHTPVAMLADILDEIDVILLMTVNPGFGGQTFIPAMLHKIEQARRLIDDHQKPVEIEIDGGVNTETAASITQAGATILVAGTALYQSPTGMRSAIDALRVSALTSDG